MAAFLFSQSEVYAAVAFRAAGAVATGSTSLSVPYPSTIAAGDLLVLAVGNKYPTTGPATPAGWTLVTNGQGSGGLGTSGTDRGAVYATVFVKQAIGTESGSLTVTLTGANSSMGRMFRYTKAAGTAWDYAATNGSDATANTAWSVTCAANPGITSGDMLVVVSAINGNVVTSWASESVSATGATFTTHTERQDSNTNTGDDLSFIVSDHTVTAGTASAAPVFTMAGTGTPSTNSPTGASVILRIREVPPPTLISIAPNTGSTAGGTAVTITGTNFTGATGATAVKFGGNNATSYTVNSATQITATAPAGSAGTVDITVTTPGGTSATSTADQFTYVAAPTVTGIAPASGPTAGATVVIITGTNFTGATPVKFGSVNATSYTINSATQITATAPPGAAGTVDVTVTTPGGTSATSAADQFTYMAAPTVTAIAPNNGPTAGATVVIITGTNFTGATPVKFGSVNATSYTFNSTTQITATAPPEAAGTVDITVTTPGGTSATSTADQFTYVVSAPIAEYRLDETSAGPVADSSGHGLSGTLNGGVTVGGSGKLCTGYNFNGSNAFVSVPNTALLNPTQITVAAWVRHSTATIKNWEAILAKGDSAYRMHLNGGCSINNDNTLGGISFAVNGGCAGADVNSGMVPVADTWYHVVGTYDGATISIYVNGGLKASSPYSVALFTGNTNPLYIGENAQQTGRYWSGDIDEVKIYGVALSAAQIAAGYANESAGKNWDGTARVCPISAPNHLEIQHGTGSGVTCAPSTLTIKACADTLVPCTAYTGGVSGMLSATGSPTVNWVGGSGFSIGSSGSVAKSVQITTPGSVTFGVASPAISTTCNFGSPSCTFTASSAGAFVVAVPSHVSCVAQAPTVTVPAACGTALDGSKSIGFRFAYATPGSGATPTPHVPYAGLGTPGAALATGSDAPFNLTFSSGVATLPYFVYDDAGSLTLTASYTGSGADAGLSMTGTSPAFVAAPASFAFSAIPAAPLTAGLGFNATVTAMNACATPALTPNFINQSVTITSSNPQPAMGNATAINTPLTGFSSGAASTNLTWNEVGTIDLNANLANYLGSGLSVSGTRAGVGRFHPAYFDTAVTQGCGTFTYAGSTTPAKAGQPFTVIVKAKRFGGDATDAANTANYAGTYAYLNTLSNGGVTTGLTANTIAAASFANGVGSASVTYAVATPQTAPLTLTLRATDSDTPVVSSSGHTEGTTQIRSGRARILNAYGSELLDLPMTLRAQYWNGTGWVQNTNDNCTGDISPSPLSAANAVSVALKVPTTAVDSTLTCVWDTGNPGRSGRGCTTAGPTTPIDKQFRKGAAMVSGPAPLQKGDFNLWLQKPTGPGNVTVTVDVPTWLEFNWTGTVGDPSARATFGIYKSPLIYRRENY